ncbi:MAG: Flp family type IVb pilin [Betaproteobacteria bacterium]|nr:Flp family type IVb pilin [Betaproteobacteria bacterium]MDE2211832.1 Flp family type IVb pilin [Betaproteobacteria bacterium]
MKIFAAVIRRFLSRDEGVTAIEYGLIAALIGLAIIGGITTLGVNLETKFNSIASSVGSAG